jgi:recombination protein RecR
MRYPDTIQELIEHFNRLPSIGKKTAERLAFFTLKMEEEDIAAFSSALLAIKENITYCDVCGHITEKSENPCYICNDTSRDQTIICVVEQPKDVIAMEKMQGYVGRYHVLGGAISPMDGVGPDDIRVKELIVRLQEETMVSEVIIATNPTIEGETTALYIAKLLADSSIKVTRIARGIPIGGDLEYADEMTLSNAIEGRREM